MAVHVACRARCEAAVAAPPGHPDGPACPGLRGAGDRGSPAGHQDYEHHESGHVQMVVDTTAFSTISGNITRGDACGRDLVSRAGMPDID